MAISFVLRLLRRLDLSRQGCCNFFVTGCQFVLHVVEIPDFAFILSEKLAVDKEKELGSMCGGFSVYGPDMTQRISGRICSLPVANVPGILDF